MVRLLVAACAVVAVAVAPTGARAGPAWLVPQTLSESSAVNWHATVAMDTAGNAIATWSRAEGSGRVIEASVRPVTAGAWQAREVLSTGTVRAVFPEVVFDPAGNALAVWTEGQDAPFAVRGAYRPAGGNWRPQETVSANGLDAAVDMDAAGNAVAVWVQDQGQHSAVQTADRSAASGIWGAPQDLSSPGLHAWGGRVAVNERGDAVAVWTQLYDAFFPTTYAAFRPAGGGWGPAQRVSLEYEDAIYPDMAIDEAGNAVVIWTWSRPGEEFVQASARPAATGVWDYPQSISLVGQEIRGENLEVDRAGDAVALWWHAAPFGPAYVQAAVRPAGGWWHEPQNLSVANMALGFQPDLAVSENGTAVAVWTRGATGGGAYSVEAAVRSAGASSWTPPTIVSATQQDASWPRVGADAVGNAVAAWNVGYEDRGLVQAAGYDGTGPTFGGLQIPPAGPIGVPLTFSVTPYDVWSAPLGQPLWAFGDGATAQGEQVTHAYARAGTFTVGLSQGDTLGTQSNATGTVVVSPGPPGPPPPPPGPPPAPRPRPARCVVPRVIGLRLAAARRRIRRVNCSVGRTRRARSLRPRGRVVAQSPRAGRRLRRGAHVNLVVSRGRR